jgi:hypothetical protein
MRLTEHERAMLDGGHGEAAARAMDLLVRYGEALGAERLVETRNVAGAFNASTPSVRQMAEDSLDRVFSELNLDSDDVIEIPHVAVPTCQLITGIDNDNFATQGVDPELADLQLRSEQYLGKRGINLMCTCTPYQVGNVPVMGEHCAWMESSAVIYANSVLGARTNVEGKESTGAASLTGRIPYWGLHCPENRFATASDPCRDGGRRHGGVGRARLFLRLCRRGGNSGLRRSDGSAFAGEAEAFRCGGGLVGRRRTLSHARHHARGGVAGRGLRAECAAGADRLWRRRAQADLGAAAECRATASSISSCSAVRTIRSSRWR